MTATMINATPDLQWLLPCRRSDQCHFRLFDPYWRFACYTLVAGLMLLVIDGGAAEPVIKRASAGVDKFHLALPGAVHLQGRIGEKIDLLPRPLDRLQFFKLNPDAVAYRHNYAL